MPLSERFGFGLGFAIGVQAEALAGTSIVEVTGIQIVQSNLDTHRVVKVGLAIDGEFFILELNLHDETFTDRTLTGKQRTYG